MKNPTIRTEELPGRRLKRKAGPRTPPCRHDDFLDSTIRTFLGPKALAEYRRECAKIVIPTDPAEIRAALLELIEEYRARLKRVEADRRASAPRKAAEVAALRVTLDAPAPDPSPARPGARKAARKRPRRPD